MLTARFHTSLDDIDANAWDTLAGGDNPFVTHAFLDGLENCGCIRAEWGWQAHHLTLHQDQQLVAAAPLYLKGNSHGEYVFDWGWAHAFESAGGAYYPKLLLGVPYSPIPGPRLLTRDDASLRRALVDSITRETARLGLSSAHANFLRGDQLDGFNDDWLARRDIQYHWHNRDYGDFDDFLAALKHKKRKNIRHERRQVAESGLECGMFAANTLDPAIWAQVHPLYQATFDHKGNHAALTSEFFDHLAATLGENLQVSLAKRGDEVIAMALFLRGKDTLYGRYWGAREEVPGLHFELCYYQGIEHAIANRLARFEPGAQGRHKLARGFLPTLTHSRHYLEHAGFRAAVAQSLNGEAQDIELHHRELMSHTPYVQS